MTFLKFLYKRMLPIKLIKMYETIKNKVFYIKLVDYNIEVA